MINRPSSGRSDQLKGKYTEQKPSKPAEAAKSGAAPQSAKPVTASNDNGKPATASNDNRKQVEAAKPGWTAEATKAATATQSVVEAIRTRVQRMSNLVPAPAEPPPTENALAEIESGGLPAEAYDPFPLPPPQRAPQGGVGFSGERFKLDHQTGEYVFPRIDDTLPKGSIMPVTHVERAWVRIENGGVAEKKPFVPGQPYPDRSELLPPPPPRGTMDMWKDTYYVHCLDEVSGEPFTFYHSAWTGRTAIERTIRLVNAKLRDDPNIRPMVQFNAQQNPPAKGYSAYWSPVLKIVGWVLPDGNKVAA